MAETVGLESPCDLVHKDKTPRVLTKIPVSSRKCSVDGVVICQGISSTQRLVWTENRGLCLLSLAPQLLKVTAYAWDQRVTTVP